MLNEKQVWMGRSMQTGAAWRCSTWQRAPLHVCLRAVGDVCVTLVQEPADCQLMKRFESPPRSRQSTHPLCLACLHRLHRLPLSSYSTSLPPSLSLSPTSPPRRLLICPSSVSPYRTRSTYSGYAFIHSEQISLQRGCARIRRAA